MPVTSPAAALAGHGLRQRTPDPHIRGDLPAAASRGTAPSRLQALIAACTEGRLFGVIGEPRVNARKLNVALDTLK
jgi:K+-transporting ATPase ATPase C chain